MSYIISTPSPLWLKRHPNAAFQCFQSLALLQGKQVYPLERHVLLEDKALVATRFAEQQFMAL